MLTKIVMSVIVAVVVTLACILLGSILVALTVEVAVTVGNFLKGYASLIGVLSGLWYFLVGTTWPNRTT